MQSDVKETIQKIVNYIIEDGCQNTYTGSWMTDFEDVSHLITKENYLKYYAQIYEGLLDREEVLDIIADGESFEIIYGLDWCVNYIEE